MKKVTMYKSDVGNLFETSREARNEDNLNIVSNKINKLVNGELVDPSDIPQTYSIKIIDLINDVIEHGDIAAMEKVVNDALDHRFWRENRYR